MIYIERLTTQEHASNLKYPARVLSHMIKEQSGPIENSVERH